MLRTAALAGAAAALLAVPGVATAQTTLRVDSWLASTYHQNTEVWPQWAKQVEDATAGRVKMQISYPPNVNPATFYDRAVDGVSDLVWGFHGYTPGRFVLTQMAEIPGLGVEAEAGSVAFWRAYNKHFANAGEHKEIKLLALFVHGPGALHSRRPIISVDQLKGFKVRIGGGTSGEVANALGMVQVAVPAPKIYEIVSQGVADGVLSSIEGKNVFKLSEVAPYALVLRGGFYYGTFFIGMNPAKFAKLGKEDQAAIDRLSGEHFARLTGKSWEKADAEAEKAAQSQPNAIMIADAEMEKTILSRLAGIEQSWIEKAGKKGVDAASAKKALDDMRADAKKLKSGS